MTMATSSDNHRVTKRSSNACTRCRKQKIKCSGLRPCANCSKRNLSCVFDDRDNKVLVTQGYLSDLQDKVARLEQSQEADQSTPQRGLPAPQIDDDGAGRSESNREPHTRAERSSAGGTRESSPGSANAHPETSNLTNPLIATPSQFLSSSTGRPFYLGTSSNWSFLGHVLNLVHKQVRQSPLPATDLLFDGTAYELLVDGPGESLATNSPIIPSIDYAIFLTNAVKFHCSQMVHLFDEDAFTSDLHVYYCDTESAIKRGSLWYIHFLLILAFGKTFVQNKQRSVKPPGGEFFVRALQLLPDNNRLCREPLLATEILCCIALYLQALDCRNAAHVTIGQAMRIALAEGMHTDMPIQELGEPTVQRCRKIWWTIYILDRQMTSLMGLPQSIQDDEMTCRLPSFSGSAQRTAALSTHIKLARIYATIGRTVYGVTGRLRKKFVLSIKTVLNDIAALADELRQSFPLQTDERFGGISRMPAHLHLLYYQSIVVVTRPLLFCCLKKLFESPRELGPLISSRKIRHVLNMSLESSQKILHILETLQEQGLLESFLPWDLDSLFVSTTTLILSRFVDPSLLSDQLSWADKAFAFFDAMISNGNRIAEFRLRELRKLDEMLTEYALNRAQLPPASGFTPTNPPTQQQTPGPLYLDNDQSTVIMPTQETVHTYSGMSDEGSGYGDDLTADQILAFAESMDIEGTDWLNFTTMDNFNIVDPGLM